MPDSFRIHQKPPVPTKQYLAWLDLLRGLAAALVVFTHLRGFYFAKWSDMEPASQTSINFGLFLITRLGREAVIIFFVLSGFLVGGNALRKFLQGRFVPAGYWAHRFARLYTVLIPALAITALLDLARIHWLGRTDFNSALGFRSLMVNLAFLQNIAGPSFGSNAPLWSLAYEFWFYVFGGCLLTALMTARPRWQRFTVGLAVGVSILIMWGNILCYLPIWCLGAALSLWRGRINRAIAAVIVLVFLISLVVSTCWLSLAGDYCVALGTGGLILWLAQIEMRWPVLKSCSHGLANFSFTTYAVHYPLVGFLLCWLSPIRRTTAGLYQWMIWLLFVVMIFGFCWLTYFCFERHTGRVRGWFEKWVFKLPIKPVNHATSVPIK